MTTKLPVGVAGMVKACEAGGWTYTVTHGTGSVDAQAFGDPRGDGTRPKLTVAAPCESIGLRARHDERRRAVRAVWVCRTDKPKRAWTLAIAWRGRHADEHTPRQLTATELRAYLAEDRP